MGADGACHQLLYVYKKNNNKKKKQQKTTHTHKKNPTI
jgi:hypothetical protein